MINVKQLKTIAAFIEKDCFSAKGGLTINFDKSEIFACNGPNAVLVELVDGLEGKGQTIVPRDVVMSAIVLIGDGYMRATREDFCGIPFKPLTADLIKDYRSVFTYDDIKLPGRPGLYPSSSMKLLEKLERDFKGHGEFYLPSSPEKPLILEIGQAEIEATEPTEDDPDWVPPTEIVKAAIMPLSRPLIKNTWDGINAKEQEKA